MCAATVMLWGRCGWVVMPESTACFRPSVRSSTNPYPSIQPSNHPFILCIQRYIHTVRALFARRLGQETAGTDGRLDHPPLA